MWLQRLFLALALYGTPDLGKRASPGFFLSTLDQGLRSPEYPSHQCQGPSEFMGVQDSLLNGTIPNERVTYCRSSAIAKYTLNQNHYTLEVPLEYPWMQKAPSSIFLLGGSEIYEGSGATVLLLSPSCPPCLGILQASKHAGIVSAKRYFHKCWPPLCSYWHFLYGKLFPYRIEECNRSKLIATDCCLNRFSVAVPHWNVKQLFWADLFSDT